MCFSNSIAYLFFSCTASSREMCSNIVPVNVNPQPNHLPPGVNLRDSDISKLKVGIPTLPTHFTENPLLIPSQRGIFVPCRPLGIYIDWWANI